MIEPELESDLTSALRAKLAAVRDDKDRSIRAIVKAAIDERARLDAEAGFQGGYEQRIDVLLDVLTRKPT